MRVLLIEDRHERVCFTQDRLEQDGHAVIGPVPVEGDLLGEVIRQEPDVVVVDLEGPDTGVLERIAQFSRQSPRPIVMCTPDGSRASIRRAVAVGVSAYVVGGLNERRSTPLLELAVARFEQMRDLEDALEKTRRTLNERKVIDRAKGILMNKRGMSEDRAYKAIRTMAMEQNRRMVEVANNLISAARLLG